MLVLRLLNLEAELNRRQLELNERLLECFCLSLYLKRVRGRTGSRAKKIFTLIQVVFFSFMYRVDYYSLSVLSVQSVRFSPQGVLVIDLDFPN